MAAKGLLAVGLQEAKAERLGTLATMYLLEAEDALQFYFQKLEEATQTPVPRLGPFPSGWRKEGSKKKGKPNCRQNVTAL